MPTEEGAAGETAVCENARRGCARSPGLESRMRRAAPRDPSRRITRRAVHRARYAPPVVPSDTLRGPLWTNLSRPVRIAPAQA